MATAGSEMRRRQQQVPGAASYSKDEKPRSAPLLSSRGPVAAIIRNLPWILGIQILFLMLIIVDPFGLRKPRDASLLLGPPPEERSKALLGIADVEEISARMAVNGTLIVLICPNGYVEFLENWLLVTAQHTDLGGNFLILAEDEDTFTQISATYPMNAVLRMDVKEPIPDLSVCSSPNKFTLQSLHAAYRKVVYSREIMNADKNVMLCDVTAVWAQNALPHFVTADTYLTLGDVSKANGGELMVDFPSMAIMQLQPPLPRGVGKLPPLSDEVVFFQNNVGSWVTLDYWAVVLEAMLLKECNSTKSGDKGTDSYTNGASIKALMSGVHNSVHLSPRPRVGLMPPGKFPPPTVFFEDASWRALIEKDTVIVRVKLGAAKKEAMKERLKKAGLWKLEEKQEEGR